MKFSASAAMQARCIVALVRQRVRNDFRGSRGGYLWALIEPLVITLFLKLVIQHGGNAPPLGDSFAVFFATAFTIARQWRQTTSQIMNLMGKSSSGSLPAVFRVDSMVATVILNYITAATIMAILLTCIGITGATAMPYDIIGCLGALVMTVLLAMSTGLIFSALEVVAPALQKLRVVILLPMYVLSGFAFLIDRMPPESAYYLSWNPVLHCVELFRESFYRGYECRHLDTTYLTLVIVMGVCVGLMAERAFRRKQRRSDFSEDATESLV